VSPFLNKLIGFLPLPTGLVISQTPSSFLWLDPLLTIFLARFRLAPLFPKHRFSNLKFFGVEHQGFYDLVKSVWSTNISATNSATRITAKFKLLRAALKKWSKSLSDLKRLIKNCHSILEVLDSPEEQRPLFVQEYNFRKILKNHILMLLKHQKEY